MSLQLSDRFKAFDENTQNIIIALLDARDAQKRDLNAQTMAISRLLNRTEVVIMDEHTKTRAIIIDALQQSGQYATPAHDQNPTLAIPRNNIAHVVVEESRIRREVERSLLNCLEYPMRADRQEEIAIAHKKTFEWIYKGPGHIDLGRQWSDFGHWLRYDNGIYWINGKAASGKSTLMRYICDHPHTKSLLDLWASPLVATTATFFFWNSGTPEQKSQSGFLRSLLFEVLQQYPELVPIVLPWLWARQYSNLVDKSHITAYNSWTLPKLEQAFKRLIEQDIIAFKLCLFVDGLDEYDGDHEEIATLFQLITASSTSNIKVCVSSRPLLVFEDAFGEGPGLRLQDLTYRDIVQYVGDKLGNNPRFRQLTAEEPELAPELTKEVVNKADGVFLWVILVVKSLLAGLGNRDSIADLQRRLKLLPSDLEALYSHMVTLIDPFYIQEASQIFQLVRIALELGANSSRYNGQGRGPLTTLELAFATIAKENLGLAITAPKKGVGAEAVGLKCKRIEDRLKVCCAGLLEVQHHECKLSDGIHIEITGSEGRIQYLHRSVRDYLEQPETWASVVSSNSTTDFNPYFALLQASILQLKLAESSINVWHVALTAFEAANYTELIGGYAYGALIDEMDKCFRSRIKDWCSLYFAWLFGDYDRLIDTNNETFLAALIHYGLSTCLETRLEGGIGKYPLTGVHSGLHPYLDWKENKDGILSTREARPLLIWLKCFRYPLDERSFDARTLRITSLLLSRGCNPNELYQDSTPWKNVLSCQREITGIAPGRNLVSQAQKSCWINILRLYLQNGADPDAKVVLGGKRCSLHTALDALTSGGFQVEATELRRQLEELRAPDDQVLHSKRQRRWTQCLSCGL